MAWQNLQQRSLSDLMLKEHKALTKLDEVHSLLYWDLFEAKLTGISNQAIGAKAWSLLIRFKALLLQSWYRLFDPQLEKQLARDLLFRRFIGLDILMNVPEHSTFWRFRQKLAEELWEVLLQELNRQLSERQLYIHTGEISIVDASVPQAKQNRPNKGVDGTNKPVI